MKTNRYTEAQIIAILRQAEGGVPVAELCREHGMSNASFYKWRAKYGGMDASLISQMKAMEDENRRLKSNAYRATHRPGHVGCLRHRQRIRLVALQPLAGFDPQVQFQLAVDPIDAFVVPRITLHVAQMQET